jgi:hypothetical protein
LLLTTQVRIKLQGARGHVGKPGKGGKEQRQLAKARRAAEAEARKLPSGQQASARH